MTSLVKQIRNYLTENNIPIRFDPVPEHMVRATEIALGFNLPPILRSIYLEIGDGGFGPSYGLYSIGKKSPDDMFTLVEMYEEEKKGAEYLGLKWTPGLLPFCEWGCTICSCVDCNDPAYAVFRTEECEAVPMEYGIDEFFTMWIEGIDISRIGTTKGRSVEIINPFTRQNTTVTSSRRPTKNAGPPGRR